jgi:TetR/AcrR family transcriptional regulator, regulator of biofilm formation and stress response
VSAPDIAPGPEGPEPDGRRRRGQRRREALIEATLDVVARGGAGSVTHAAVAEAAGVGRSAVSHHFASIGDLLAAALRSATGKLGADLRRTAPTGIDDIATRLVDLFCADRARVAAGYELYLLAARVPGLRSAANGWMELLTTVAAAHTDDPVRLRLWSAAIDGYFLQHLALGTAPRAGEVAAILRSAVGPP